MVRMTKEDPKVRDAAEPYVEMTLGCEHMDTNGGLAVHSTDNESAWIWTDSPATNLR